MNVIRGRMRLFCVSNVIASFVCAGFLSTRYYNTFEKVGQNDDKLALASDEVTPLSQLGEGEKNIIEEIIDVPDWDKVIKEEKKEQEKKQQTKVVTTKTVTKSVVTKKAVASSAKYTPAVYSSVTGDAIVEYAKRYLGLRYVYAGRSLATGTDCSGFTSLIYKEFGVSLPKTVEGQYKRGTYVSKSNLQKGDIVFYSNGGSSPTHVAMYIGGGKVIHESNYRDGVKISPVNMMRYISARRVINATATKIVEQKIEEQKKQEEANVTQATQITDSTADNINKENTDVVKDLDKKDTVVEMTVDKTSESNQEIMDVKNDETKEVEVVSDDKNNQEEVEKENDQQQEDQTPKTEDKNTVQEEVKIDPPKQEVDPPKEEVQVPKQEDSQTVQEEKKVDPPKQEVSIPTETESNNTDNVTEK